MVSSKHTVSDSAMLTGWFTSSFSGGGQGDCVEVARGHVAGPVRDSKCANGPALLFTAAGRPSSPQSSRGDLSELRCAQQRIGPLRSWTYGAAVRSCE